MENSEFRAIFRDGHFDPLDPVRLPEGSEVVITVVSQAADETNVDAAQQRIYQSLSRSYETGQTDTAARHNEHQP